MTVSTLQTVRPQKSPSLSTVCPAYCFIRRDVLSSVYAHCVFCPFIREAGELISDVLEPAGWQKKMEKKTNSGCHGLFSLREKKGSGQNVSSQLYTSVNCACWSVRNSFAHRERTSPRLQTANFQLSVQNESHPNYWFPVLFWHKQAWIRKRWQKGKKKSTTNSMSLCYWLDAITTVRLCFSSLPQLCWGK